MQDGNISPPLVEHIHGSESSRDDSVERHLNDSTFNLIV
jgi:hypothetical protein